MNSPPIKDITQRFFNIVQEKSDEVIKNGNLKEAWSNDSNSRRHEYQEELNIPFIWGIGTAVTLFATFRISKYTGSLRKTANGYYQFENLGRKHGNHREKILSDIQSIPFDMFVSLMMGASTTLFLIDDKKLQKDLVSLPLVQGRSLVAQELCPAFIKEYQNVSSDTWNAEKVVENNTLQQIQRFVQNCEKRQKVIDWSRNELESTKDAEYMPSPGALEQFENLASDTEINIKTSPSKNLK